MIRSASRRAGLRPLVPALGTMGNTLRPPARPTCAAGGAAARAFFKMPLNRLERKQKERGYFFETFEALKVDVRGLRCEA